MTEMAQVKVEGQTVEVLSESGGPPCARPLAAPKHPIMRVRVMATYMVLLLRLVLPALVAACRALLRNQRCVRERVVPAVFAFIANSISLSSLSGKPSSEESLLGPEASPGAAEAEAAAAAEGQKTAVAVEPVLERSVTCNVLFDPGDGARRADVIFIHGLHGSLEKTWRQGSWREGPAIQPLPLRRSPPPPPPEPELLDAVFASAPEQLCQQEEQEEEEAGRPPPPAPPRAPAPPPELYSDCWPRDWLPQDCPGLRVIALNYTTDPFLWRPLWMSKRHRTNMLQRGREMMEHLQDIGVGKYPIIWVGHSKGGLFVKQMIVDAFENGGEPLAGIYQNTKAIMFYSVPHMGSACADINLPLLRQSVELTEVQKDCREVLELHSKFLSLVEQKHLQAEVFSFIETIPTFMRILYIQIVSLESADAAIGQLFGAPLDHRNICKPTNRQCFLYKELINLIQKHL